MDKQTVFKTIIATMNEVYDKKLSPAAQDIWWNLLRDYNAEQLSEAMHKHCSDPDAGRFPPKPADLVGKIIGNSKQKQIAAQTEAEQAWSKVLAASKDFRNPPEFNDSEKRALMTVGGLSSVGMCDVKQLEFKRRDFISAYANSELSAGSPVMIMDKSEAKNSLQNLTNRLEGQNEKDK